MPQPQGPTKWYPYNPNLRAGNDGPMCPLHCLGVCLMQTSKIREIILGPGLSSLDYTQWHPLSLELS